MAMPSVKLSSFAASFHDYELDLRYYHGKDILHQGCLLKLDSAYSWDKISSKIRNKIRKAQQLNVKIKRVKGTEQDVKDFRTIWFDPKDVTIPDRLEEDEIMYLAYMDNELAGGLILTPSSPTVLYMHNLGSNEAGKRNNIPALILWHAVEDLEKSHYKYIDVGVSFRPTLYTFFKNWQTDSYPIIFTPPFILPDIRLTPFENTSIPVYSGQASQGGLAAKQFFGDDFTILPRAIYAIKAVLQHIGVKKTDNVAIFNTFDTDYITRCVTAPVENLCSVSRKINDRTKAAIIIHDFGYPCKATKDIKRQCEKRGIPLIEDCAWSYGTALDQDTKIGEVGDYAVYSLPKILPLQYGAVLKGLTINDEDNWNNYQLLDYFKRELVLDKLQEYLPSLSADNDKRRDNWQYLAGLFAQDGFEVYAKLEDEVFPGALLIKLDDYQKAFERFELFGIETGRYYQGSALFLPVHQNLSRPQLDYIYGVFRGMLNLSSEYRRQQ